MAWIEKHRGGYRVRYRLDEDLITENGYPDSSAAEDRAADIESDQRRGRFVDPRLAQTTIDEWIRSWTAAHYVTAITQATYDSHIRNHILPRWSGTALGDIAADRGQRLGQQPAPPQAWRTRAVRTSWCCSP